MKTATSSTKNRPHYWSDPELKKVGIEIRDERRGVLLCKKCGSEWSAEPRSRRTRASRLVEVPAGVPRLRVGKPSPECADGLHLAETPRRRPVAAVTAIARAPPRDTRNAPRPSGAPPR